MELITLDEEFSVSKLSSTDLVDLQKEFSFLSVTDDEISYVCKTKDVPTNVVEVEHNWKAVKINGVLDFSLIGIIAKIATLFAANKISIFVISTFNTDYILVKTKHFPGAVSLLRENDYVVK